MASPTAASSSFNRLILRCLARRASGRPYVASTRFAIPQRSSASIRLFSTGTTVDSNIVYPASVVVVGQSSIQQQAEFPSQSMILKQRDDDLSPEELDLKLALQHHQGLLQDDTSTPETSQDMQDSLLHLRTCLESLEYWDDQLMVEQQLEWYAQSSLDLAACIFRQGKLHMLLEDAVAANAKYQKALELYRMEHSGQEFHADIGNVLVAMAGVEFHRQHVDGCLQLLNQSEDHFRYHHTTTAITTTTQEPHPDLVKCLDNQGMMYRLKQDYQDALEKYQEALQIVVAGAKDPENKRQALQLHIADVLSSMDEIDGALEYYQTIRDEDQDPALEGVVLHAMGVLHAQQRQLELAEQELTRAVELKQSTAGETHPEVAKSLLALGSVLGVSEDDQNKRRALECFQQALMIERGHTEDENDPEILLILRNIAVLKGEKVAKW
ncbi:guanine nucleotide exchange factor [Seminavis robusta]|uniref:Guanine nucleotide exchange factor n=1 Tax=Seminavis robusta TaxID=568900 RepID=A0A9N8F075_9STRA|nr:guanine nucleotide exchange factor [Seminavis robusta]|eukprot:Sro2178_g317870.1 guanine nucleotide exchange factor (440) ;mRNA; r:3927-5246